MSFWGNGIGDVPTFWGVYFTAPELDVSYFVRFETEEGGSCQEHSVVAPTP